jgi:hypothetical protein
VLPAIPLALPQQRQNQLLPAHVSQHAASGWMRHGAD